VLGVPRLASGVSCGVFPATFVYLLPAGSLFNASHRVALFTPEPPPASSLLLLIARI